MDKAFWRGKRVLVTGHTGFKGAWLCHWLARMGAQVYGYALAPATEPNLYTVAKVRDVLAGEAIADIRDTARMKAFVAEARPEVVFHMAAQAIVLESYKDPVGTFSTNVVGTASVMDALRGADGLRAIVVVTSDKCYENREWVWGYRETDPMGGYDPYSASKGCTELVAAAMRDSFFNPAKHAEHGVAVASARAGNVVGGGDWAEYRLIPDFMKALLKGEACVIRNPGSIRPWQHVLEPLSGYLRLAQALCEDGPAHVGGWNFGPREGDAKPVSYIADALVRLWKGAKPWVLAGQAGPHENVYLKLDISKARALLGWQPVWSLDTTLETIVDWYQAYRDGADMAACVVGQIGRYQADGARLRAVPAETDLRELVEDL